LNEGAEVRERVKQRGYGEEAKAEA